MYTLNLSTNMGTLGSIDLLSHEIVLREYNNNARGEEIVETGFNTSSGYVYIALENGIQIASCFGQDADFIIYDFESGEEHFCDTYKEAEEMQEKLQEAN